MAFRKPRAPVPAEYQPLHKYLDDRFADTVVLTFVDIEAILGIRLPDVARVDQEWWANGEYDTLPSLQARAWTEASRTATSNLRAQKVTFERTPD
jgi:hypothetical protein